MCQRIAGNLEELAAACHMQPPLQVRARGVVAFVDEVHEFFVSGIRCRAHFAGITAIAEFALVALAAPGTSNSQHGLSMSVRVGTYTALIDRPPRGEALETQMLGERMWPAGSDQVRGRHASGRNGFEAAVAPPAVQDQSFQGRPGNDGRAI